LTAIFIRAVGLGWAPASSQKIYRNVGGIYEGKEKEEAIIVYHASRNCTFGLDWTICGSCVFVSGPLLAPTTI